MFNQVSMKKLRGSLIIVHLSVWLIHIDNRTRTMAIYDSATLAKKQYCAGG